MSAFGGIADITARSRFFRRTKEDGGGFPPGSGALAQAAAQQNRSKLRFRGRNPNTIQIVFKTVQNRSRAEVIAEAQQAVAAAKRLVDEQTAIVRRLERTGGCNSEAIDLLNNLRELLAARERRLARVLSWPSLGDAA
jgi:hypothetical protein